MEIWSRKDQSDNYFRYLLDEIFFYESCLRMLKAKFGTEKIDYRHYLNVAELESNYLSNNEFPSNFNEFQSTKIFNTLGVNLIVNNIYNAQKNIKAIITQLADPKDLFIYYELLGDLEIHIFCYYQKFKSYEHRESLLNALLYYKFSIWHKTQLEKLKPQTYFDGLHGWQSHGIFHDFYGKLGVSLITDVRDKNERLEKSYPLTQEESINLEELYRRDLNGR